MAAAPGPGAAAAPGAGDRADALQAPLGPPEVPFATRPGGFRWGLWRGSAGVRPKRRHPPRFSAAYAHMMALEAMQRIEALHLGFDDDAVRLRAAVRLLIDTLRRESARVERWRARVERREWAAVFFAGGLPDPRLRGGQRGGQRGGRGRAGR